MVGLEREVARTVKMHLGAGIVALECFRTRGQKKWVTLAPDSQHDTPTFSNRLRFRDHAEPAGVAIGRICLGTFHVAGVREQILRWRRVHGTEIVVVTSPSRSKPLNERFYPLAYIQMCCNESGRIDGNDGVPETNALVSSSGLLCCDSQNLPTISYRAADGLLLASAQSEKIQAVFGSSATVCYFRAMPPRRAK